MILGYVVIVRVGRVPPQRILPIAGTLPWVGIECRQIFPQWPRHLFIIGPGGLSSMWDLSGVEDDRSTSVRQVYTAVGQLPHANAARMRRS